MTPGIIFGPGPVPNPFHRVYVADLEVSTSCVPRPISIIVHLNIVDQSNALHDLRMPTSLTRNWTISQFIAAISTSKADLVAKVARIPTVALKWPLLQERQ